MISQEKCTRPTDSVNNSQNSVVSSPRARASECVKSNPTPPAQCYIGDYWGFPSVELDHHLCILFPKALRARPDSVALRRLFLFPLDCIARRYQHYHHKSWGEQSVTLLILVARTWFKWVFHLYCYFWLFLCSGFSFKCLFGEDVSTRLRLKLGRNAHNFFNLGVTTLLPVAKRIIYAFLDHL